ncbi:MAG TPA: M14 family zinc carboxypeptidase [Coleofasciculaceae cyanobacterium]|jgi:protein MpaA
MSAYRRELARSVQGREIDGVFFGPAEPAWLDTLFIGVFHGDEGISAELLHRFINTMQAGRFAASPIDFTARPVLILPVLNPDGLAAGTRQNANGVDLNRNYPTANWQEENQGTVYYSGPSAASEPETRVVIELIERYQPKKIVTVHCPYKVLNFDGPSRPLAEAMAAKSGYPVVEDIGYPTPGSFGTWTGKERRIPVVTLELPPNPDDPPDPELPPPEPFKQVWQDNWASLEAAILF